MYIYFIRHGETDWNKVRMIQGQADIPLNETGQREAEKIAEVLQEVDFKKIYASPLQRAYETAKRIHRYHGCEIVQDDRLKEISYGVDEGKNLDEISRDTTCALHKYFKVPDQYVPPKNGETISQLLERCTGVLETLEKEPDGPILVSCHGAVIHGMITVVEKYPIADFWKGKHQKNCAVTIMEYDKSGWRMVKEALTADEMTEFPGRQTR